MPEEAKIKNLVIGPLLTNCYLVYSGKEAAVIDPGGEVDDILLLLNKKKLKLKYIINTHSHPDHTFGNKLLKNKTKAKILIHRAEEEYIKFKPDKFLEDNEEIKIGDAVLKVLHTPGHTKGSICLLGNNFIFTGDTLFKDGIGRTDLVGSSASKMRNSLKKLSTVLGSGMFVYPGHGKAFEVGKEGIDLKNIKKFLK